MSKKKALFILGEKEFPLIYGPDEVRDVEALVDFVGPAETAESIRRHPEKLQSMEILFSGWGAPKLDETFLAAAPKLEAVFYGAGSIRAMVSEAFWERGIKITTAWAENAVPVSEFTLSQILYCLKSGFRHVMETKRLGKLSPRLPMAGGYGSTVALLSLGMIGRMVRELLRPFDLKVLVYDPYVTVQQAEALQVEKVSLEDAFRRAEVVSCHTPWLPETEKMVREEHFRSMKPGASFINTARGAVVDEEAMIRILTSRSDLFAVLDVTYPEPPAAGSPLYTLPNVILTPHIAGSMGTECHRMGRAMVKELERYLRGEALLRGLTREKAALLA
ncbi:MAG: hydroxyacid dehydrogenase [Spirochaetia bacterium]|nr:hydroxyacid dehydrogenase [Spirochaetia bacterium]